MSGLNKEQRQQGMALVVSLLFLLVLTMISVVAATNSRYALQMASNAQDELQSFQAAEAGVYAALATSGTGAATDLFFLGKEYGTLSDEGSPLGHLASGAGSVTTHVILTASDIECPLQDVGRASSRWLFDCDFYRIESGHLVERRARSRINAGVAKTIIGKQQP